MSDLYPKRKSFSNKRFSEIISEGFYLFRKSYLKLIIPMGIIFIISLIIKNFIITDLNWQIVLITPAIEVIIFKDPASLTNSDLNVMFEYYTLILSAEFLNNLITSIFNVISMGLVSNYLFTKFSGNPSNFNSELKSAFKGKLLIVVLLIGVGIAVGSFLIFIPSIFILGYYIFYIFTYHSEEGIQPIKEAREVARGSFWKIIGIFLLSNLVIFVCDIIFLMVVNPFLLQISNSSWYNPSTRNYVLIILSDLLYNLPALLLAPLFICLLTSLYGSLRNNREQRTQYPSPFYRPKQSFEASNIEVPKKFNSGLYCPFCGKYISKKIDFCPHCREKIIF